jgi:DNA-binding transcriptional MerR regulator
MATMLSLSEVAERAGIQPRTLRRYGDEGFLDADAASYPPAIVQRVRLVRLLLAERMSSAAIRATLAGMDEAEISKALASREIAAMPRTQSSPAYRPK